MDDLLTTRTRLRSKATKLCNDLRSYREGDRKALDPDQLALKLHHVEKLQNELQGVQDQLDKLGQADDSSHSQTMEDEIFLGSRLLKRLERDEQAQVKPESQIPTAYTELKTALSLKIPTFQGDIMKWAEFWELYAIAVHNNPKFAEVQKFVVLKSHLAGVALKSIQGIPVTGDGYTQAVEALRERFELDEVRKETLLRELLNMPSVRHNDLKAMRSLIDHLSAHTRALTTLGVTTDSFSSLLLPVAKDKIPEDWRLEWARRESGNFPEFLEFLKREVRIRESAKGVTAPTSSDAPPSAPSATSSLTARREPRSESSKPHQKPPRVVSCTACGRSHLSLDQCENFRKMQLDGRWEIAKTSMACFRCLGSGHRSRHCKGSLCANCGRQHHLLLHNPDSSHSGAHAPAYGLSPDAASFSPTPTPTRVKRPDTGVSEPLRQSHHRYNNRTTDGQGSFFQTALAEAAGLKGRRKVRILLDGGSDSSYIRSSLVKDLDLPVTGSATFACLGFQERAEEVRSYDRVQVELQSLLGGCSVKLEMWSTDQLCQPLPKTTPPYVPSRLELADDFEAGDVELLIGIDNLYRVVLWEQAELGEGLRAIETVFGYVLHGQHDESVDHPKRQAFHCDRLEAILNLDAEGITDKDVADFDSGAHPQSSWSADEKHREMGSFWNSEQRSDDERSDESSVRAQTQRMTEVPSQRKVLLYHEPVQGASGDAVVEPSCSEVDEVHSEPAETQARVPSDAESLSCTDESRDVSRDSEMDQNHGQGPDVKNLPTVGSPTADSRDVSRESKPKCGEGPPPMPKLSGDGTDGSDRKLGHSFDDLGGVKVPRLCRSSHDCWDPGGHLIGCPTSA